MRLSRTGSTATLGALALAGTAYAAPVAAAPATPQEVTAAGEARTAEYVVLLEEGADRTAALAAVAAAGGRVLRENRALGTVTAAGPAERFVAAVSASPEVAGAATNRRIGRAPGTPRVREREVEQEHRTAEVSRRGAPARRPGTSAQAAPTRPGSARAGMDPLDRHLWGLRMVRSDLARQEQDGRPRVLVGILDTGIDSRHPDLTANVDLRRSRNFAPDLPEVDGPCEFRGCVDPAGWDDNGHGTHVAGTVAADADGFGISGVAPDVSLVNLRGGQDSGYFFLGPVTDALTYAGDVGVDVVNMSFYVDPWLYNCFDNPADDAQAQAEQRTIIRTMRRALRYAHERGVTLVGSLGNGHEDLGAPRTDTSSPDFPPGQEYERPVDNATCFDLPVEGPHVIGVSALGPGGTKADYSNYGVEQIDVAAPGGYFRDYFGTPWFATLENLVLSSVPVNVLRSEGLVDSDGQLTPEGEDAGIVRACPDDVVELTDCGYYDWFQGTSMAAPHASGVAALIVSEYGAGAGRDFGMDPVEVRRVLRRTAQERACPDPRTVDYLDEGRDETYTATCEGDRDFNGFYGHGIVDAYAAVTLDRP